MDRIWSEIQKPDKYRSVPVDRAVRIPLRRPAAHEAAEATVPTSGVDQLRDRFLSPSRLMHYFYKHGPAGSGRSAAVERQLGKGEKASVPADGFGVYVRQIWETIKSNKELNLPSQKEMLATYRCDEIIHQSGGAAAGRHRTAAASSTVG